MTGFRFRIVQCAAHQMEQRVLVHEHGDSAERRDRMIFLCTLTRQPGGNSSTPSCHSVSNDILCKGINEPRRLRFDQQSAQWLIRLSAVIRRYSYLTENLSAGASQSKNGGGGVRL